MGMSTSLTTYEYKLNKVDESIWHIVGFLQQFLSPFFPSVDSELLETASSFSIVWCQDTERRINWDGWEKAAVAQSVPSTGRQISKAASAPGKASLSLSLQGLLWSFGLWPAGFLVSLPSHPHPPSADVDSPQIRCWGWLTSRSPSPPQCLAQSRLTRRSSGKG